MWKKILDFIKSLFKKTPAPESRDRVVPDLPVVEVKSPTTEGLRTDVRPVTSDPMPQWPPGANEFVPGVWYVGTAGPFSTPVEYYDWLNRVRARDEALVDWQISEQVKQFHGPFTSLNDEELAYVRFRSIAYTLATHRDLYRDLLSGTNNSINEAINRSHLLNPGSDVRFTSNDRLVQVIDQLTEQYRK